jgi:Putative outer membrane beta-barrel porin, MtrB/PioB
VDVPEELDEFRYAVGTELGYLIKVARNSRVFVGYLVTFESFRDNGIVPSVNADAAFQVHAIGTGVRHELTPTLAVEAGLGYSFTTSDAPQKDGHDGVIGNIKLTKTFHNGQASLGYARRFSAGGSTGDVVIDDTVSTIASINLTGKLTARFEGNVTCSNFQGVTTITPTSNNSDQRFLSIRPSLTYQILRPWSVSLAYTYEYTDYTDSTFANFSDHRLFLSTQYALREWLALGLSYRYGARHVHGGNITVEGVEEFTGNQIMLTVTASPKFLF